MASSTPEWYLDRRDVDAAERRLATGRVCHRTRARGRATLVVASGVCANDGRARNEVYAIARLAGVAFAVARLTFKRSGAPSLQCDAVSRKKQAPAGSAVCGSRTQTHRKARAQQLLFFQFPANNAAPGGLGGEVCCTGAQVCVRRGYPRTPSPAFFESPPN